MDIFSGIVQNKLFWINKFIIKVLEILTSLEHKIKQYIYHIFKKKTYFMYLKFKYSSFNESEYFI